MNDKKVEIKDVLLLNERVFSICDAWPLSNSYKKLVMYLSYLSVHLVIMNMDLYDVMGELELMVENIVDNTIATTTYFMLFLFRFSKLLKNVITTTKDELSRNEFRNNEEMQLYLSYNNISDNFGRYAVTTTAVIAVMWYITPMLELLKATSLSEKDNSSKIYRLPFRIHSWLDYEDNLQNYILMYVYQMPLTLIALLHISSISLLLSLVLHVCGKFSILSYRIQNITEDATDSFQRRVKEMVDRHVELILRANSLNSALQIFLAIELTQTSIRMAVLMYTILLSDDIVDIFTYGLYVTIVTLMLYLYSYIGERLEYESRKVNDAFYDADWLKLSIRNQKFLLYCMSNGRKTLHLTAGKFYSFSLPGFIQVEARVYNNRRLLQEKDGVRDVLVLNERVYSMCDVWPFSNTYKKFVISVSYLSVHLVAMNLNLYDVIGDLTETVKNITDSAIMTTTFLMIFQIRFSKLLRKVLIIVKEELANGDFENVNELDLYLSYNRISYNFGKYAIRGSFTTWLGWYTGPLLHVLLSGSVTGKSNDSVSYELPFAARAFIDYEDNFQNYLIMFVYQLPIMFVALMHINTVSLIFTLVLHVCGKFSILSHRIQNIQVDSLTVNQFRNRIKELVNTHLKLIAMAKMINAALDTILLIELVQTSIRLGVLVYMLSTEMGNLVNTLRCTLYISAVTGILYLYSFIGECMAQESKKVNEAYYDSNWLKLSTKDQKILLLCMIAGRRTMYISVGKVYEFSLFGFIGIMKTSFGFVSLLQAVI
ncbi:uncharacterized protein LOC114878428 [Osmia bicornis bicornis]|uniref:uncharacterized protein LOC114878428 n=1 Tax=Osmia bicornis bicornis TaxID=1437191 RepID=UPI001EAF7DF1|nr:uncharacterized protein LOC114878428 [Osmia bicornis bicornis]